MFLMRQGKSRQRALALLYATLFALAFYSPGHAEDKPPKNLLILHSYHPSLSWTEAVMKGMQEALTQSGEPLQLHEEYMDMRRFSGPEHRRKMENLLLHKLATTRFDLVLLSDNDALDFILTHRSRLTPEAPIIFCGINHFTNATIAGHRRITGVAEEVSLQETIDAALKLHPGRKEIVVIGRTAFPADRANREAFLSLLQAHQHPVKFTFWDDLSAKELQRRLPSLQSGSLVFINGLTSDETGRQLLYAETTRLIRDSSSVPLYSLWDVYLGHGIIGGKLVSGYLQGKLAGELAARVLRGEDPDKIPIIRREAANKFMFDYHELSRFGLSVSSLPDGSEVIHPPSSSYVINKEFIWGGLFSLGIFFCIIVLLAVNMLARRKAEKAAHQLADEKAVMAEIGRVISSTLNIEETYGRFAEEVRKLIPFDRIMISLNNLKEGTATVTYVSGIDLDKRKLGDVYPLRHSANEEVMRTRSGVLIQPETVEELEPRFSTLIRTFLSGLLSMMTVPLISANQVIGALHFRSKETKAYTGRDLTLAERIGDQIAGAIANAQLFAERKLAERSLAESEVKFRDLYDNAPLGYHEYDAQGRITHVNRTDLFMLGYTAEEMIGQFMWKFNVEEEMARGQILAKLAGTLPPGRNLERTYRRKDGTTFPVLIEDKLILDEKGQIKGIRSTIQDITDRKKVEKEVARLAQENAIMAEIARIICSTLNIEEVYERFAEEVRRLIPFDRIGINIKKFGEDGVTAFYKAGVEVPNRRVGKVFPLAGTVTEEVLRTRSSLLISPDAMEGFVKRFPGYLPSYQAGLRSLMAIPLFSRDEGIGVLIISSLKQNAYTEEDLRIAEKIGTQIAGAVTNAQLFAERKRAEEELRCAQEILEMRVQERTEDLLKARDAAEAANRAKSDFLANMSHELRTPLNHIIGFTELVVDKQCGELNEVQGEYLNDVLQSSRHLLSLINDILDLSKVEAGKLELEVTEIHLPMLLEGSLAMVKEKALKHGIQLMTSLDGIPGVIQADERKFKQILYNLLSNAMKFTPDGGSVTLSAWYLSFREGQWFTGDREAVFLPLDRDDELRKGGRLIEISVQDTGIGIKKEDLERIFDPFEQGDNSASRRYQGTGLGLSLTKKLVELHGGRIWARSEGRGRGSTFTFVIPV